MQRVLAALLWLMGACAVSPTLASPVAAWHLDETSWANSGDVRDASGNGHHATAIGDAQPADNQPARPGSPGTCGYVELDGNGDRLLIGNPAALNFSGQITLAAWIRNDTDGQLRGNILDHGYSPTSTALYVSGGRYNAEGYRNYSPYIGDSYVESPIPNSDTGGNAWVHLASTYDGSRWRLYRNGIQVANRSASSGALTSSQSWAIGSDATGVSHFRGAIDEPRIYDRALSAGEIQALYQEVHPCPSASNTTVRASHDGQGVYYCPESVQVGAYLDDGSLDSQYSGEITLTPASPQGYWQRLQGHGSLQSVGGQLRYTFDPLDQGQARFAWVYTGSSNSVGFGLSATGSGVQSDPVAPMSFAGLGFELRPVSVAPPNAVVAGEWAEFDLVALNGDPSRNSCVVAAHYHGDKTLRWGLEHLQPSDANAPLQLRQSGLWQGALGATDGVYNVRFQSGVARVQTRYHDSGELRLRVQDIANSSLSTQLAFWHRPHHLGLQLINPAPPGGSAYAIAGQPLQASLIAYASNGQSLPSFGRASPGLTAHLRAELVTPQASDGALLGSLQGETLQAMGNGQLSSAQLRYEEVGEVRLVVDALSGASYANDWFAALQGAPGSVLSLTPGRWRADHLQLSLSHGALAPECGASFSYIGQPLSWQQPPRLEVTAHTQSGQKSLNYGLAHTPLDDHSVSLQAADQDASHLGRDGISPLVVDHSGFVARSQGRQSDASWRFEIEGDYRYQRSMNAERAPFVADLPIALSHIADADGATLAPGTPAQQWRPLGVVMRFARARSHSPTGAWQQPEPLQVWVEYYNGQFYTTSRDDDCSQINRLIVLDADAQDAYDFDSGVWASAITPGVSTARFFSSADQGLLSYQMPSLSGVLGAAQVRIEVDVPSFLSYPWQADGLWQAPSHVTAYGIFSSQSPPSDMLIVQEMF